MDLRIRASHRGRQCRALRGLDEVGQIALPEFHGLQGDDAVLFLERRPKRQVLRMPGA